MPEPKVVSVIGLQNSGKTRLIRSMLAHWTAQKLQVAVIKHDGHAVPNEVVQWQKAGSDTQLFADNGATYTLLAGGSQSLFYQASDNHTSEVNHLLQRVVTKASFDGISLDVIIVEGFKQSSLPKIAVVRTEEQLNWLNYEKPEALLGVVMPDGLLHLADKAWRVYHEDDTVTLCQKVFQLDGGE